MIDPHEREPDERAAEDIDLDEDDFDFFEPDPCFDDDLADVEADRYERGLDRIAARLGY